MRDKVLLFVFFMVVVNTHFLFAQNQVPQLPETVVTATRTEVPINRASGSLIVVDRPGIEMKNPLQLMKR